MTWLYTSRTVHPGHGEGRSQSASVSSAASPSSDVHTSASSATIGRSPKLLDLVDPVLEALEEDVGVGHGGPVGVDAHVELVDVAEQRDVHGRAAQRPEGEVGLQPGTGHVDGDGRAR